MTLPWMSRAIGEVLPGEPAPRGRQPYQYPESTESAVAPPEGEPVVGAGLGPTLQEQMENLRTVLGGG